MVIVTLLTMTKYPRTTAQGNVTSHSTEDPQQVENPGFRSKGQHRVGDHGREAHDGAQSAAQGKMQWKN